jgi:4-amino-4-deoxychorismate lyase
MQLLETILVENGQLQSISYHNDRFNQSRLSLFGIEESLRLEEVIQVPVGCTAGLYRCRVIYEEDIQGITFTPYLYKPIQTLKMVDIGAWDYSFKYADRSFLIQLLAENPDVNEVMMTQNGYITDCTIANLAFYDGKDWFTPNTPLLKGTKRQQLLDKQAIKEAAIKVEDLKNYEGVCLINTFRNLELEKIIKI